ncbi:hypothetical protein [Rubellicoccus peritrichatus]|uniref:TonB C-terminal domain-containing protein n=1 Tax=Rubellicoccus peritrichatus TaxID=3080537 RepID=A0AAQ3LII3_9BACT|nr:hypothetical protein [Puniceicoccus sp. CR14]WOO42739.1 hypothetical protein RZN69_06520 [Puniceicoccus sp. CR14]
MSNPESEIPHRVFEADKSRVGVFGWPIGLVGAAGVMLLIPISQYLTAERPAPMEIEAVEIAMPPPPPPVEHEPPPPEPEEQQEPPELDMPPPQLSLEQLDLALNPGTGGNLTGEFGLGNFEANQDTLGGIDTFEIDDLDSKPGVRSKVQPKISRAIVKANKGKTLLTRIKFDLNEKGQPTNPNVVMTTIPGTEDSITKMIVKWRFDPPMKDGQAVKAKNYILPFKLQL